MNCLDGDPNEEKVLALIEPAIRSGAEYFCIDAGWYADVDDWWDSVGEWKPSRVRFPRGLEFVLDSIRDARMKPGLWMEPEVVGVKSPVAVALPDGAFFQRLGRRVVEQSRYHLDFRHTAVTTRLDKIIDGLITGLGVQYFKFDANVDVTQGTDCNASSPGDGMFEHRRAYMAWVNGIYDRFPDLVIESCSSGGQRLDYHTLATHSIQSTSDQTDPVIYAAISANILTALTPEQSASWALPQPEYHDDLIALCMVNSLMGKTLH
ncbi:glycoside hydrolase family 36 protein [Pseudocercospora fijiensis CIRAD86]|uniref:alpha-galactosidase n=1 Tax=Pseudocercospora fijiensis (strain CIRAD86) TaxID=383855 RepID=N1Q5K0_PSEFD|nr:glycoside hydrolase family 36 protein [Pseudocercospora fijiensis CIRAD86]EME87190.1 glycoside hydrolase family 36 protein [Pseudocercospora fijiensis CIRAD86]